MEVSDVICVGCGRKVKSEEALLVCDGLFGGSVSLMVKVSKSIEMRLKVRKSLVEEPGWSKVGQKTDVASWYGSMCSILLSSRSFILFMYIWFSLDIIIYIYTPGFYILMASLKSNCKLTWLFWIVTWNYFYEILSCTFLSNIELTISNYKLYFISTE